MSVAQEIRLLNRTLRGLWPRVGVSLLPLLLAGCIALPNNHTVFAFTTDQPANRVTLTTENQAAIFDIESPGGIGEATMQWTGGAPPERILLRLHLRGLEELRLSYADQVQVLAMPSTGNGAMLQSIAPANQNGAEQSITPGNPAWMQIRIGGAADGEQTSPRQDSLIEVELPPGVLSADNRSFAVRWIDFFR